MIIKQKQKQYLEDKGHLWILEKTILKTKNQSVSIAIYICYELKSLELDNKTNSDIGVNTRKLNKELFTK